jgi:hypothetical protein
MKTTTQFLALAAMATLLGGTAAWADDPALQHRLALQRQQMERDQTATTIAFYHRGYGIGHATDWRNGTEPRVNEHYVPYSTAHYPLGPAK